MDTKDQAPEVEIDARRASTQQLYFGYPLEDVPKLTRYKAGTATAPSRGFYTDYFGIKTRLSFLNLPEGSWFDDHVGGLPFPDDSLHAETIEYLAVVDALHQVQGDVTCVELGAGYGPWLVFAGTVGIRNGARNVRLVAVEADQDKLGLLRKHFEDNGFPNDSVRAFADGSRIATEVIHGAAHVTDGYVEFGSVSATDWGAAVQPESLRQRVRKLLGLPPRSEGIRDYRGLDARRTRVPAISCKSLLARYQLVSLLHVDIQGAEQDVLTSAISVLNSRVRAVLVGTHSRPIEGALFELFVKNGWGLVYEKPCRIDFKSGATPVAMTTLDGVQYWTNPRLFSQSTKA